MSELHTHEGAAHTHESDVDVGAPPAPVFPVELSPKALEMVKEAIASEGMSGAGLRIAVLGGGCSGFQYGMDFEKEERPGDFTSEIEGLKVFVDPMSARYLKGCKVDYVTGLQGAGFKFENPGATRTCGCGSSFQA